MQMNVRRFQAILFWSFYTVCYLFYFILFIIIMSAVVKLSMSIEISYLVALGHACSLDESCINLAFQ